MAYVFTVGGMVASSLFLAILVAKNQYFTDKPFISRLKLSSPFLIISLITYIFFSANQTAPLSFFVTAGLALFPLVDIIVIKIEKVKNKDFKKKPGVYLVTATLFLMIILLAMAASRAIGG